ncbi:bola-like protein [Nemania abortiva]|nr:bola-like protein [Nemania abortiva]
MLGFRCSRIVTSALRQTSRAAQISTVSTSPSHIQARHLLLARTLRETRPIRIPRYSTTSTVAADAASPIDPVLPEKPDYLNDAESAIWDKLTAEFSPTELMVQDISGGCGSMYGIEITSEKFRGANMLKQQRMVNAVLGEEMKSWHGVQLRTRIPQ